MHDAQRTTKKPVMAGNNRNSHGQKQREAGDKIINTQPNHNESGWLVERRFEVSWRAEENNETKGTKQDNNQRH